MKRTYNSNSITLKVNSQFRFSEAKKCMVFSAFKTALRHDALTALLISANPLR